MSTAGGQQFPVPLMLPPNSSFKTKPASRVGLIPALGPARSTVDSPYSPPKAELQAEPKNYKRISLALVAFCSGMTVTPLIVLVAAHLLAPDRDIGNARFWVGAFAGSLLAAALTLPFKRMPAWLVALVSPIVVLATIVGLAMWAMTAGRA
jgi:hypothetical protein